MSWSRSGSLLFLLQLFLPLFGPWRPPPTTGATLHPLLTTGSGLPGPSQLSKSSLYNLGLKEKPKTEEEGKDMLRPTTSSEVPRTFTDWIEAELEPPPPNSNQGFVLRFLSLQVPSGALQRDEDCRPGRAQNLTSLPLKGQRESPGPV